MKTTEIIANGDVLNDTREAWSRCLSILHAVKYELYTGMTLTTLFHIHHMRTAQWFLKNVGEVALTNLSPRSENSTLIFENVLKFFGKCFVTWQNCFLICRNDQFVAFDTAFFYELSSQPRPFASSRKRASEKITLAIRYTFCGIHRVDNKIMFIFKNWKMSIRLTFLQKRRAWENTWKTCKP